jgi:hypothetical protein
VYTETNSCSASSSKQSCRCEARCQKICVRLAVYFLKLEHNHHPGQTTFQEQKAAERVALEPCGNSKKLLDSKSELVLKFWRHIGVEEQYLEAWTKL